MVAQQLLRVVLPNQYSWDLVRIGMPADGAACQVAAGTAWVVEGTPMLPLVPLCTALNDSTLA